MSYFMLVLKCASGYASDDLILDEDIKEQVLEAGEMEICVTNDVTL